jgi:hypothetical protein
VHNPSCKEYKKTRNTATQSGKVSLDAFQLIASVVVMLFQTGEAYSSLGLTKVKLTVLNNEYQTRRQCTCMLTLRRVRVTSFVMEKK